MRGRFLTGMTAGALIGAAAGMIITPNLDRDTKRMLKRSGRYVRNAAQDAFENVRDMAR